VNNRPGSFGYSEATRKFELPPASAVPDLNIFASRSTIDTGVISSTKRYVTAISENADEVTDHQDLTVNESLGFRISEPLPQWGPLSSRIQVGADYKSYKSVSFETNSVIVTQFLFDTSGNPYTQTYTVPNASTPSLKSIEYVPLSIKWDGSISDKSGTTDFEVSYNPNLWFTANTDITNISGSAQSTGYWHIISASVSRDQDLGHGWRLSLRADGQWTSQPLISNEQFGIGGVNGIRGYREGAAFGDTGWRVTSEIKTPTHVVGYIGDGKNNALNVRASGFFDYGETYLLDAQGQPGRSQLCGIGVGGAAAIGRRFDARLLFAWPLLNTGNTESQQLRLAFSLSAQF
jgi:hypothetical protein